MLKKLMFISALTVSATSAFAMPDLAGEYNCKISARSGSQVQSGEAPVRFSVSGDKLLISGLEAPGTADDGMPCSNQTENVEQNGAKVTAVTKCDAQSLSLKLAVDYPAQSTKLSTAISVEKVSATQAKLSIFASGSLEGQALDAQVSADCTRK